MATPGVANTILGNVISRNSNGVHLIGDLTTANSLGEIANNYIGTDPTGSFTFDPNGNTWGNVLSGVLIEQSGTGTPASGTPPAESIFGNVISGNGMSGVTVQQYAAASPAASPTAVSTSPAMSSAWTSPERTRSYSTRSEVALPMGNALDGVLIDNVLAVDVGGTTPRLCLGIGNVISGNLAEASRFVGPVESEDDESDDGRPGR